MIPTTIVLIGAPGAGKSTVGSALAEALGYRFVDTDAAVEQRAGQTLADLFIDSGAPAVHSLERQVLAESLAQPEVVVALGSGALDVDEMSADVEGAGAVVWLRVTAPNAISRVGLNVPRPVSLGNVRSQFAELMKSREGRYSAAATHGVDTDHREVSDLVAQIHEMLAGGADE